MIDLSQKDHIPTSKPRKTLFGRLTANLKKYTIGETNKNIFLGKKELPDENRNSEDIRKSGKQASGFLKHNISDGIEEDPLESHYKESFVDESIVENNASIGVDGQDRNL